MNFFSVFQPRSLDEKMATVLGNTDQAGCRDVSGLKFGKIMNHEIRKFQELVLLSVSGLDEIFGHMKTFGVVNSTVDSLQKGEIKQSNYN